VHFRDAADARSPPDARGASGASMTVEELKGRFLAVLGGGHGHLLDVSFAHAGCAAAEDCGAGPPPDWAIPLRDDQIALAVSFKPYCDGEGEGEHGWRLRAFVLQASAVPGAQLDEQSRERLAEAIADFLEVNR